MDAKKSKKADIEQHKTTFLGVGFIVALSLSLIAFEWSTSPSQSSFVIDNIEKTIIEDMVPLTKEKEKIIPPEIRAPDIIEILKNDEKVIRDIILPMDIIKEGTEVDYTGLYTPEVPDPDDIPMVVVSEMPAFRGGTLSDFSLWVQKNIRYPELAAQNGIEEKIYLTFVVEKDGTVSSTEITRGNDASLKEEVIRVMEKSPKWTPGSNMNRPARVRFSMVINFSLQ